VIAKENILTIEGPEEGFETEEILFLVQLNGMPVQAKVDFADQSKLSNQSTGYVSFILPKVSFSGEAFDVTAWIAGNVSTIHRIFVKNQSGALIANFLDSKVEELEEFSVLVKANDQAIKDAEVWFNSNTYYTNESGFVSLQAPDVLVTSNFGLSVIKSGYGSFLDTIRIHEAGQGIQLMEVIGPRMVNPDSVDLEYHLVGLSGGIADVEVTVLYEGMMIAQSFSDAMGVIRIDAPTSISEDYFLLKFSKQGYRLLSGLDTTMVYLVEEIDGPSLILDLIPSEIIEGNTVKAEVVDSFGESIQGVSLWIGDSSIAPTTDASGVLEFRAPVVFFDQEQYIYAIKQGYNIGEKRLTIRNNPQSTPQLIIEVTSIVNESSSFSVSIADKDGNPVDNAEVWFDDEHNITNDTGVLWLTAPAVEKTKLFMINVSRDGFLPASTTIEIVDIEDTGTGENRLIIAVVPHVLEGEQFEVMVKSGQGTVVTGARVMFEDTSYYTDFTGRIIIVAPEVPWDSTYNIVVSRVGYESAQSVVVVKNVEGFPYWFLVGIIVVILIVGFTVYYRNRYHF
jgi:hypothetical protein